MKGGVFFFSFSYFQVGGLCLILKPAENTPRAQILTVYGRLPVIDMPVVICGFAVVILTVVDSRLLFCAAGLGNG